MVHTRHLYAFPCIEAYTEVAFLEPTRPKMLMERRPIVVRVRADGSGVIVIESTLAVNKAVGFYQFSVLRFLRMLLLKLTSQPVNCFGLILLTLT